MLREGKLDRRALAFCQARTVQIVTETRTAWICHGQRGRRRHELGRHDIQRIVNSSVLASIRQQ